MKAAPGMGTKRKLPSGQWRCRIRIHRRIRSQNVAASDLADDWLRAMRRQKVLEEAGLQPEILETNVGVTYGELVPELDPKAPRDAKGYLDHIEHVGSLGRRKRVHTANTIEGYTHDVGRLLDYWGKRVVKATTAADVEEYEGRLRVEGYSTSTIRHRLDRLNHLMQFAVRKGYLARVPCKVDRPALVLASRPKATTEDELTAMLERIAEDVDDPRVRQLVLLAADAGLRREEILRLRGKDLSFEGGDGAEFFGWIHVATDGEEFRTKSGRGRNVPIFTRRLLAALEPARFAGEGKVVRGLETKSGVSQLAGRHGILPHDLRRRFATRLGSTGTPAPKIQRWMGHADLATTQKYILVDELPVAAILTPRVALEGPSPAAVQEQRA